MSLISFRNLVGPLQGWRLATIILAAVLFAVFRLSGGTIRVVAHSDFSEPRRSSEAFAPGRRPAEGGMFEQAPALDARTEIERLGRQDQGVSDRTDVLGELLTGHKPEAAAKKEKQEPPSKLDEIEKSLGLR